MKIKTCFFILLYFFLLSINLFAQNRYALVIGNANYNTIERLTNPVNDATDVASKLRTLGYQVQLKTNIGNVELNRAINDYIQLLARNSNNEGFFWFAGHGVQIDGENYLLPIDVDHTDDISVKFSSYPVNKLIDSFEYTARNKINVVVLDACRNNPFRNMSGRFRSLSRGLTLLTGLPPDLFVIYSTAAGDVAADGNSGKRNSPFAEAFIKNMDSTEDLSLVVRNITRETLQMTNNRQRPYHEGSIIGFEYYSLNPRKATTQAPIQTSQAPIQNSSAVIPNEITRENRVQENIPQNFDDYLPLHLVSEPPKFNEQQVLRNLVYPVQARSSGTEGRVILELFVDSSGKIQKINTLLENPQGNGFGEAAVKLFTGRIITPAKLDGKAVAARMRYPINFRL